MENKKINKLTIILPVLVLIVLTVSATFAYYKVTTVMNSTPAQVDVHAGNVGLVTFKNGIENLELKLTQKDMSQTNTNKIFYAVTSDTKEVDGHKYSDTEKNHTILTGSVSGTNTSEKYICEGNLTVSLSGTMVDYLQKGDVKIKLMGTGVVINSKSAIELDAKDITNSKPLALKFLVDKDNEAKITGDVMLINRDAEQKDLAGTEIEIRLDLEEKPACHIAVGDEQLVEPISLGEFCDGQPNMGECITNKVSTISDVTNMTSSEVGGMYRYQGTDDVNNWICFGTTNKEECTKGGDTYGDGLDKYMYRIIGVTQDGELALIKETGVKEGSTVNFQWNDKYLIEDCGTDGAKCTWANSRIYNRLNGLCKADNPDCNGTGTGSEGQTNIFIGNSYYDYLKDNTWLGKISDHEWKYGNSDKKRTIYNGDTIYAAENAFTDNVPAKIGLQYLYDYYYAYPGGKPGNDTTAKNAWIHLSKDGISGISNDWIISKYGVEGNSDGTYVHAYIISVEGTAHYNRLNLSRGARPVFYLTSDIKISNTAGSKEDPFMIEM